jgi:hypothetical protein
MDEVDRLFSASFSSDFFGMLRAWHDGRTIKPILKQLDMMLVAATESNAFIKNPNQSPFNVATKLYLEDFTDPQVRRLNTLHGLCMTPDELTTLQRLVRGHPYLIRQTLYCIATDQYTAENLFSHALLTDGTGPFSDHLRHCEQMLQQNDELRRGLRQVIEHGTPPAMETHHWLLGLGLIRETATGVEVRNQLYAQFFGRGL